MAIKMEISREAISILKWMRKNDSWKYFYEIEAGCKHFSRRAFNALKQLGYVNSCEFEDEPVDFDEFGRSSVMLHYQISDAGKAYLEAQSASFWAELRSWFAVVISFVALAVSIVTAILK